MTSPVMNPPGLAHRFGRAVVRAGRLAEDGSEDIGDRKILCARPPAAPHDPHPGNGPTSWHRARTKAAPVGVTSSPRISV